MVKKGLVVLVFVRGALVGRLVLVKSPDSENRGSSTLGDSSGQKEER